MNLSKEELKKKLIDCGLCIDNEFLDKYCQLIIDNKDTPKEKFKTHRHHIIPRVYYKQNNLTLDNSNENCVNLLYKYHVLCHFYLIKCSSNEVYRRANICAIQYIMRALNKMNIEEINDINTLNEIQEFYEISKHVNYFKEDTKEKIRDACKGSVFIYKDGVYKYIKTDDLSKWFADGWIRKHPPQSEETKQKLREKTLGKIYIHNENEILRIDKSELDFYINQGYTLGQGKRKKSPNRKGDIAINKNGKTKYVKPDMVNDYLSQGYTLGFGFRKPYVVKKHIFTKEERYQRSLILKGRKSVHKDGKIKYLKTEEEYQKYLQEGWLPGTDRANKSVEGKIWINDGIKEIYILPIAKDDYLQKGWKLGRLKRKNKGGGSLAQENKD